MRKTYGYVRVSSKDQNEARQYLELLEFGIEEKNIYMDKLSGKDFNRPSYHKLVYKKIRPGDLLVIKSIDRLGRNYNEILQEWKYITKEKNYSYCHLLQRMNVSTSTSDKQKGFEQRNCVGYDLADRRFHCLMILRISLKTGRMEVLLPRMPSQYPD